MTLVPIHGDLTLSNIIFSDEDAIFIDWEHFSDEGFCWGFDIAYLVLSAIYLPSPCCINFSELDSQVFSELWLLLQQLGVNHQFLQKPFSYFQSVVKSSFHLNKIFEDSPNKLYPMTADVEYIDFFENIFIPKCCSQIFP